MIEYKMTYMWRILSILVFLPVGGLFMAMSIYPDKTMDQDSIVICAMIGGLLIAWVILIWVYCFKKKVILKRNNITLISLFGKSSINIIEKTKFRHHSIKINAAFGLDGVGSLLQSLAEGQGEEATTHINIIIENEKSKIKLNTNIKGISELRDKLISLELDIVLPRIRAKYNSGELVSFGLFALQNGNFIFKKQSIPLNQFEGISFEKTCLVIHIINERKPRIKLKTENIINMYSFLSIIK